MAGNNNRGGTRRPTRPASTGVNRGAYARGAGRAAGKERRRRAGSSLATRLTRARSAVMTRVRRAGARIRRTAAQIRAAVNNLRSAWRARRNRRATARRGVVRVTGAQ